MKSFVIAALLGLASLQEVSTAIAVPVQKEAIYLQRDDSDSSDSDSVSSSRWMVKAPHWVELA